MVPSNPLYPTNGHPSPATDVVQVRLPEGWSMREVLLFDAMGRAIPLATGSPTVDIRALAPGMYVLRADHAGQVLSTRFQKL